MQRVERNIKLLYIYKVSISFLLIAPILVIFMQHRGLSFLEIMLLQSLFSFSSIIFEVPSGYFSDKLGRKKTLIIASVALSVSIILFSTAHSVGAFAVSEIFFGFAYSMISGTDSSLLYETLIEQNKEEQYAKIWGDMNFYALLGVATASILGGFLANYSLDLVAYLTIIPFSLTIVITLLFTEPKRVQQQNKKSIKDDISEVKTFLKGNIALSLIILLSAVIFMFNQSAFWLYQPFLKESNISLEYYGVIFASFQVVAAFASKYSYSLQKWLSLKRFLIVISLISPISIILMGLNVTTFGFVLIYAQQITRSFKNIIVSQIINEQVQSGMRATVVSIASLVAKLSFTILLPIVGYFMDLYSLSNILIALGGAGVAVIGGVLIVVIKKANSLFD